MGHGGKFVAKEAVEDPLCLRHFQNLLHQTHRKVYTRDRHGQKVPDALQIVSVMKVENADRWVDYNAQQEQIRHDLASDPRDFVQHPVDTMTGELASMSAWLTRLAGTQALDAGVNEAW